MTTTRAKFKCISITHYASSIANPEAEGLSIEECKEKGIPQLVDFDQPTVTLQPVYQPDDDDSENHKFWQASPSGKLEMTINNPAGAEVFELHQFYYLDFTPAPA